MAKQKAGGRSVGEDGALRGLCQLSVGEGEPPRWETPELGLDRTEDQPGQVSQTEKGFEGCRCGIRKAQGSGGALQPVVQRMVLMELRGWMVGMMGHELGKFREESKRVVGARLGSLG